MAEKYLNKSLRLKGYDYSANGKFHITICTNGMKYYFGDVKNSDNTSIERTGYCPFQNKESKKSIWTGNSPSVLLSEIGEIAKKYWIEIPRHYDFVELDEFIFMPNHMHGILYINKPWKEKWESNQFGVQSGNLGAIIRAYKSSVKRYANENKIDFRWKDRYWDEIIRNESDLNRVRHYILQNPTKWIEKKKKTTTFNQ